MTQIKHFEWPSFELESQSKLEPLHLVYETYGQLNHDKDNVILIHHALSASSHVASHNHHDDKGWWENMVGPNKTIDTNQFYVICINNLGSCFGSSGPASNDSATGHPYQQRFPFFSVRDIVHSQKILLDHLGIHSIKAIIGNSMGGMLSLQWAIDFPKDAQHLILSASCHRAYPSTVAYRAMQRDAIKNDPKWCDGFYREPPIDGFKLARKIGHYHYRNPEYLNQKFKDKKSKHEIIRYFEYNSSKFARSFDPNSYLYTLDAMDKFDITQNHDKLLENLKNIKAKILVISIDSDMLFTPEQQLDLYTLMKKAGLDAQLIHHHSNYGHDAFLVETDAFGQYIQSFML